MNGNFRSPELGKRYEYSYYDLQTPLNNNVGVNNRQTKDNYLFVVGITVMEVDFKLLQLDQDRAGGGLTSGTRNVNTFCTTTNAYTFIRQIQVECNGITVCNNTRANESSNVLSLLKYTKEYAESVGKDQSD